MLKASGRSFYKASVPYPQVACSRTRRTKNNTPLADRAKVWRGLSKCGRLGRCVLAPTLCDRYRASLHVVLALLVSHPCLVSRLGCHICASTAICAVASVHRQPFVPLHLCNDSHLCRCIVQRLCVAVFMHPCITTLCDRYRASFARL